MRRFKVWTGILVSFASGLVLTSCSPPQNSTAMGYTNFQRCQSFQDKNLCRYKNKQNNYHFSTSSQTSKNIQNSVEITPSNKSQRSNKINSAEQKNVTSATSNNISKTTRETTTSVYNSFCPMEIVLSKKEEDLLKKLQLLLHKRDWNDFDIAYRKVFAIPATKGFYCLAEALKAWKKTLQNQRFSEQDRKLLTTYCSCLILPEWAQIIALKVFNGNPPQKLFVFEKDLLSKF